MGAKIWSNWNLYATLSFEKPFIRNLNILLNYDPEFLLFSIYSRNIKTYPQEGLYKIVHRKQPKCPSNRRIINTHTVKVYSAKKRTHHWYNINESQKHYVKWKKPEIYYMISFIHSSRTGKSNLWWRNQ